MPGGGRVNITSANEHVPYIEHQIRVVKERKRAVRNRIPFNNTPKLLTIYILLKVFRILNYFSFKGGVSTILSPKTTMSGKTLNYKQHIGINIGQYCQVHDNEDPRNSKLPRTKGAICLGPSGIEQGEF